MEQAVDYERQKRRVFQEVKGFSNKRFWNWMSELHSKVYYLAVKHYTEAAEIELPPKLQKALHERAEHIRVDWDGLNNIEIDFSEFSISEILRQVQKEMNRAAGIHGAEFADLPDAREAIDEEVAEVWEAVDQADWQHAKVEIIQTIGVLVKLLQGLDKLARGT